MKSKWWTVIKTFEHVIVIVLMSFLMIVVSISALELGWLLFKDLLSVRDLLLDTEEMFELFGFFLLVLIGVELIHTLQTYLREGKVHVEVVLEVALIAIAQKIIILNTGKTDALHLMGLAALVLTLAIAFRWVRTSLRKEDQ